MIPVNERSGKNVGVIGQLHFYLDDIWPKIFTWTPFHGVPADPAAIAMRRRWHDWSWPALTAPGIAGAHAFPDHSEPRVGHTLDASPPAVRIWFDGAIEPVFSRSGSRTPPSGAWTRATRA